MTTSGFFLDSLLALYLSEGMMIFTALLLVCSVVVFIKSRGKKALRTVSALVGIYSILYLGAIAALSVLFSSNHPPAEPEPLPARAETEWVVVRPDREIL